MNPSTYRILRNQVHNKWKNPKNDFPPCKYCGKKEHPPFRCWRRPVAKCNKSGEFGHEVVICTSDNQNVEEQITNEDEGDVIFVARCHAVDCNSETWLIYSSFINHMSYDRTLLKKLGPCAVTRVKIGDGKFVIVKGKGDVAISTNSCTKAIT